MASYRYSYGENEDLVYPNLVSAHIKTSNVSTPSTASLPSPPPSSSILKRIEECPAYQKPSLELYKFDVEREVLAREKKREDANAKDHPTNDESVELDTTGIVDK